LFVEDFLFVIQDENSQINKNIFKQKKLLNEIRIKIDKMILLLTSTLIPHLNLRQHSQINMSEVYLSIESLSNQISPPNPNETFFFRVCFDLIFGEFI